MKIQSLLKGALGVTPLVLLLSTSAWATSVSNGGPGPTAVTIGTMTFKPSPNVKVSYFSNTTFSSYVAASGHTAGDRAYGVDPDYTGMYVNDMTATEAVTGPPNFPTAATAGSTGDFGTDWTPK